MQQRRATSQRKDPRRCCRLCGGSRLSPVLTLRDMPVSHALRRSAADPDPRFEIAFENCERCGLLQIVDTVDPAILYGDTDTYQTGFHRPRHLDELITTAIAHQDPGRVIDIGCNDGSLMEALKRHGYADIVGIEPNRVSAGLAVQKGYPVYPEFFTAVLAARILKEHGAFQAIYLRHVAEHVETLEEFFPAMRKLLGPGGLLIMELPQVEPGFTLGNPAVLWEEHVNYFTEPLAAHLLARFGFEILDRRHYAFGGGAIALIARKAEMPRKAPQPPPARDGKRLIQAFKAGFDVYRKRLRNVVADARRAGYRVAMYGAAPRSCVVAAACGIAAMIDVVIDDRADIQGRLMPGTQRAVLPLDAALAAIAGQPVLCLLGVGSENEFKVAARLAAGLHAPATCISLFPPRDTVRSIGAAVAAIKSRQSRVRSA
jgi:2-polyprenyl-3-methyl-5-hydroxy-6-metoxy-1,4-benzoquinol methylase